MSVYRFKLHECDGTVSDVHTGAADDLDRARVLAVDRAREIMAREVRQGRLCLTCWIVVSDEHGNNVITLQFGEAIEMAAVPACGHETAEQAFRSV